MASQYDLSPYGTNGNQLLGQLREFVAEGEAWLKAQKPAQEWDTIMPVLGPQYDGGTGTLKGQSNTGYNRVRRAYREIVATLSNFRHAGEFKPTEDDAEEFFDRAHMLSGLDEHWWRVTFAHLQVRMAVQYAIAKGTGYLYEDWDRSKWGPGRGDIRLTAKDPADVTFIQLPKSHDLQQAYMVLIREDLPLSLARKMYASNPSFANALVPDRGTDGHGLIQKGLARVQRWVPPPLRTAGSATGADAAGPSVDIWHAYTLDGSINERPEPITMGVKGTNWSYVVPALGDPIPQGIINPATGQQWTLPAEPDDCLMFPLRRLTIFSRTGIAYDGSSPFWHGAVPVAAIRFNDQPHEALGASQVGDAKTIQDGVIAAMRGVEDSVACRIDPPALIDDRVDKSWGDAFNPRKAGARAQTDLSQGSPIVFPMPPNAYDVPPWIAGPGGFISQQEERIDYVTCARDLVAVAKARQIPGADTLEKLMEMAGPIVQDMVRALEKPLTELGEWRKAYYFQFYTRQRMIQIADPEMTELLQDVKYVPEKLIPYLKGEAEAARTARVRAYLNDFRYEVTESGINEIHRMTTKLLYVQLKKMGFPLSNHTLAKVCQVPNYGPPPKGTNTEFERWVAEQRMDMELKVELARELQAVGGGAPPPEGEAPAGGGEGPGRPQSFQQAPRIVSKDGGTRSTITTAR